MENSKSNKKILITVAVLGLFALSYFGYQNYSENSKISELTDFAQKHNSDLKTEKVNIETSIPEKVNKDTLTKKFEKVKVAKKVESGKVELERTLTGKELEDYENKFKREIVPYTEPLPEMPDKEVNNSTLYGVDSNYNGVRDDLEILAVQEFGHDRDIIEAVFAGFRSNDMNLYYAKNDTIEENRQEILDNTSYKVDCYIDLTGDYGQSKSIKKIRNSVYNNPERKKLNKKVNDEVHGVMGKVTNKEICNAFYERTKSWNIREL